MHKMMRCNADPFKTTHDLDSRLKVGKTLELRHDAQPAVAELRFGLLVFLIEFRLEARHDRVRLPTIVCDDQSAIRQS